MAAIPRSGAIAFWQGAKELCRVTKDAVLNCPPLQVLQVDGTKVLDPVNWDQSAWHLHKGGFSMSNQTPNVDAIYAGMCYARDLATSEQGKAMLAKARGAMMWKMGEPGMRMSILPPIILSDEQAEAIYPGEARSVNQGIDLGRWLMFAPDNAEARRKMAATFIDAEKQPEAAAAVARFMKETAE